MDKKWNLQDIRPAGDRRRKTKEVATEEPQEAYTGEESVAPRRSRGRGTKNRRPYIVALLVLLVVLTPGFVIGYLLDGAELTVHPRVRDPIVNGTFEAAREPGANGLAFEIMTLEAEGERQVTATGEEEVSEQATGEIEIRNTGDGSERLIKNTRFESPEGLIFRITESVVVPAADSDGPGTVRARVFADQPGEAYNIGPSEFSVPGYREGGYDELYAAITARSSAPMQGGFEGISYIIGDEELAAAQDSLHTELEEALRARVAEERPAGFILYESGIAFSYESLPSTEAGEDLVTIKEKVSLHVPIFEAGAFASHVAAGTVPGYQNEPVRIEDSQALTFAYTATTTAETDLRTLDSFEFRLEGNPRIVFTFDHEALKQELAGAAKTALPTILGNYPAIERAEAVIRPFWKRSFPENTEDIVINETLE